MLTNTIMIRDSNEKYIEAYALASEVTPSRKAERLGIGLLITNGTSYVVTAGAFP